MRIPSGDLAPARRRRRHGHRGKVAVGLAVVLAAAVAAGAYALRRDESPDAAAVPTRPCQTQTTTPAPALVPVRLPAPTQVQLRLLNGNGKDLLARSVGNELARRGFKVTATGNAPRPLQGVSRVYYGPGGRPAALLASAQVSGATVVPVPNAARGAIDVVLGSSFVRLRTPAEATAYARELSAGKLPIATSTSAKPQPSPTCR
jgi:hypothetical protein